MRGSFCRLLPLRRGRAMRADRGLATVSRAHRSRHLDRAECAAALGSGIERRLENCNPGRRVVFADRLEGSSDRHVRDRGRNEMSCDRSASDLGESGLGQGSVRAGPVAQGRKEFVRDVDASNRREARVCRVRRRKYRGLDVGRRNAVDESRSAVLQPAWARGLADHLRWLVEPRGRAVSSAVPHAGSEKSYILNRQDSQHSGRGKVGGRTSKDT